MENSKEINKKLEQIIEVSTKQLAYLMLKDGHTMDEIAKNLHVGKQTVVKMFDGLEKKKQK